jgi:serine/threonine-protein kinase HipA
VSVLADALAHKSSITYSLTKEASTFGGWSPTEIEQLCDMAANAGDSSKKGILNALADTPGMFWRDEDRPILMLRELAQEDPYEAYQLARIGRHKEEALRLLRRQSRSEDGRVAAAAVERLVKLGLGAEVASSLEKLGARSVRDRMVKLFADIEGDAAKLAALARMRWEPSLARLMVRELCRIHASNDSLGRSEQFVELALKIDPRGGGRDIVGLWVALLSSDEPPLSLRVAQHIWTTVRDGAAREQARQYLLRYVDDTHAEELRLIAARALGARDLVGFETYTILSRTARSELVRLGAARCIADLETLNSLADRANSEEVRRDAQRALDLYGHLDWLRKVGRPRRARVRFRGHDVGILEETTTLGGPTRFLYSPEYLATPGARPIAPNLKLRTEPYESPALHPFFANLLPEGTLYVHSARRLGLKREDRFGVLLGVGADVMGAVEVLPMEPA